MEALLLSAENLVKEYRSRRSREAGTSVRALDGVNLSVRPGARIAIVGASGSGKSTLAACLACLGRPTSGTIRFEGRELTALSENELRSVRPKIQLVFQNPGLAFNPDFTVLDVLAEPGLIQKRMASAERRDLTAELLSRVGLSRNVLDRKTAELSGGQRQRLAIARALALEPKALILDEALSALDCSVQAQIANLLLDLNATALSSGSGPAMLFITHDLVMAARIAEEIAVMQSGRIVEIGPAQQIVRRPEHAATQALLACATGLVFASEQRPAV
jgi:peptide/nickel transport system ATP-binding protein